jgi:hypothetical protein
MNPQPEFPETSQDAQAVSLAPFGRWHDGGSESTKTDGSTPFTTELFALTLMALPD